MNDQNILNYDAKPILISIHGIRTTGKWQKEISSIVTKAEFVYDPHDYGFFGAIEMLIPFFREKRIKEFRDFYNKVQENYPNAKISLIAHSFGTYIAAYAMETYAKISFDQIIFCGSIVPQDYDWETIFIRNQVKRVLHEYGGKDIWVSVAEWTMVGAGASGRLGFTNPPTDNFYQQARPRFRHSDFFYSANYKKRWIPFLQGKEISQIKPATPVKFNWKPWALRLFVVSILGGLIYAWQPNFLRETQLVSTTVESSLVGAWEGVGKFQKL